MMSDNDAPRLRQLLDAWNAHDPEAVAACFAPAYEGRNVTAPRPLQGPADVRAHCRAMLRAFPDLHIICDKSLVEGEERALFWRMSGTHRGPFLDIPPTGRSVLVEGVMRLTIAPIPIKAPGTRNTTEAGARRQGEHKMLKKTVTRLALLTLAVAAAGVLLATFLVAPAADASSHREAPLISKDPFADNTDTYVWIPQGQTDNVALAASWIPFEGPEGGPNYWEWDDRAAYHIHVDNDGEAMAEVTYTLRSQTHVRNPLDTFLYNTGSKRPSPTGSRRTRSTPTAPRRWA